MTDIVIPSNPADLKKLKDGVQELANSMTRIDAERDFQKDALTDLEEATGIKKKHIKRMATDYHKNQFDEKTAEFDDYTSLYESVMES